MYSFFNRVVPQLSIFHHSSSALSSRSLNLLRSALTSPYPPHSGAIAPLKFNLDVVEGPPTPDQIKTIMSYAKREGDTSIFISAHPSAPSPLEVPKSASGIVELAKKNPNAFKWPVVVDWDDGRVSIGDAEGVKEMLEVHRRKRDGESI